LSQSEHCSDWNLPLGGHLIAKDMCNISHSSQEAEMASIQKQVLVFLPVLSGDCGEPRKRQEAIVILSNSASNRGTYLVGDF